MYDSENRGRSVRIGVVDSLLEPTDEVIEDFDIGVQRNYVEDDTPDTTNHGGDVFEVLGYFAPDAVFDLYRVVAADGTTKRGTLVDAIADASRHGVDILNLSVGVHHQEEPDGDCGGHCRVADETRLAIEAGTTVVSATGNREQDDSLAVHCPALLDGAVGVGGFVARCRHDLLETRESGQYWVRNDDLRGPFCGQRDCSPTDRCSEYRYEYPWRGNVSFHNAAPDVLAPVHHPAGSDTEPVLQSGTSFGTPVVSGSLAAIIGDLDDDPDPRDLVRAVRLGANAIDEGDLGKFDGERTRTVLHSD